MEDTEDYFIDKRKYAIRFLFNTKHKAKNFRLPKEYRENFELNNNLDEDRSQYVRIAQRILKYE